MKRFFKRFLILLAVFIGCLIVFSNAFNQRQTATTDAMETPTLPVLSMIYDTTPVNRMYGYTKEVEASTLRDSLTLLPTDRNLKMEIRDMGNNIKGVNYQLISLTDGSLVENGKIKSFEKGETSQTAEFHIDTPITMNQEYMLEFMVDIGRAEPVCYYTRLVQRSGQNLNWYLSFVQAFYENCVNKSLTDAQKKQLEPESAAKNSSLHFVNIHSDIEQITWGNLTPVIVKKAVPTILEVNETTVSIRLDYCLSAKSAQNLDEYYNVTEYYRMRRNQDEVILLDFERTVTQRFDGNADVLTSQGINLGITGRDVRYITNEKKDIAVFIQAGELWEYNRSANKAVRIFTFRGNDEMDERTELSSFGIAVSAVSEEGDVTYLVYGRMSAGDHEGELGICIFSYSADENASRELLFVPVKESFELQNINLKRLAYVNDQNECFLCFDDEIYGINIDENESYILQEDLEWETFAASDSQTLVAWMENPDSDARRIRMLNLNTGETESIEAAQGQKVTALGFLGEDIVYGYAYSDDCFIDAAGKMIYPMYRLVIRTAGGEIVKDYQIEGVYVTAVAKQDDMLELTRMTKTESGFVPIDPDQILRYVPELEETVNVWLDVSEAKGTEVYLNFSARGKSEGLLTLQGRYFPKDAVIDMEFDPPDRGRVLYYVYAKGGLYGIYSSINEAVEAADEQVGVVLNDSQQYIWERGNVKTTVRLDYSGIPEGLFAAPVDEPTFKAAVGTGYQVWNLTGCSLESIRYQLSSGHAVTGRYSATQSMLITGYDQYNIWIYDPGTGADKAIAFDEAEAAFAANGNIFLSYHE